MRNILRVVKEHSSKLVPLLPLAAFAVAFLWSYLLQPQSFELMWKGRTFLLFFVWLVALELILGWENLQASKLSKPVSARSLLFVVSLLLPTVFVGIFNYAGGNAFVADFSRQNGVFWWIDIPTAVEYLVFAVLFGLTAFLSFGVKGLKSFSIPIFFLAIVGTVFAIDSVYPYDQFTPFQVLVPTTTVLAANTLGLMGYSTTLDVSRGALPQLTVIDPANPLKPVTFAVAWPCAGVESLLIFTVTILLFLKRMPISWKAKAGYFAFGAAVTYFTNILRIVSIYLVALSGGDWNLFHAMYGPLFAIPWIVSYPLVILGTQSLWRRFTNRKKAKITSKDSEGNLTQSEGVSG